ncbi:MAG: DNA-3-methyladenine glycosylase 2 family protein [Deltaproteobacteria bacterium]|nr:DNA-3-methyladenine glycosylase 2 family protein [Deltaproteobacteria bacterium]
MAKLKPAPLTPGSFSRAIQYLCDKDADLAHILTKLNPPTFWTRKPGFASLIRIILEQQVSLASARASFDRLRTAVSPLTPERFLKLDEARLKSCGFSRQKSAYSRNLAIAIVDGHLNLKRLETMADKKAAAELVRIKGIGPWTANIYLLTVLRRPDIWPKEDLALAVAAKKIKRLKARPAPHELENLSEAWKPWRAVAARLLWHYYLNYREEQPPESS